MFRIRRIFDDVLPANHDAVAQVQVLCEARTYVKAITGYSFILYPRSMFYCT